MYRTWLLLLALGLTACVTEAVDADGDGFDTTVDCDDSDATVYPGADEDCDQVDDDCDGEVDENPVDGTTYYADADGDEYGDATSDTIACAVPEGYVDDATDCDDTNAAAYPGAEEVCDGVDNNCDEEVDEGLTATWYADADEDGYGDPDASTETCDPDPTDVTNDEDCDDTDPEVNPDATEVCDEVDNDCDGTTDLGVDGAPTWYADSDGDGLGDPEISTTACAQPADYVDNTDDCNDDFDFITECDTIYDIQDGTVSEGADVVVNAVVVTGISEFGFFAQEVDGGEYSGVSCYGGSGSATSLVVGDSVAMGGVTDEYWDQTEVDFSGGWVELLERGGDELEPEVLTTAFLADYVAAEPWEGVLIQVQDVTVSDPDIGYGEWEVDGTLDVDTALYDASDDFELYEGMEFASITGPLVYYFERFKIAPRSADDLVE